MHFFARVLRKFWNFPANTESGLSLTLGGVSRWGGKCDKILTLRRTRDINKFLVIIPVIVVFQYKYWSPYTYKSSVGTGFETEIYFCKLTLRSKNYWCMSIQFRDIHINWFVFDTLISIDLSLSTTKIYVKLYTTKVNLLKFVNLVCF